MFKGKKDVPFVFILFIMLLSTMLPCQKNRGSLSREVAEKLAAWLPEQLKKTKVPGLGFAVVDNKKIVWNKNYGHTGGVQSRPVDNETLFCIRSISKSVTALAVLMAVQEGLVDLDTPIDRYLPNFTIRTRFAPHPEKRITLRIMLAHRAGFAHDPPHGNHFNDSLYFKRYIDSISRTWLRFPAAYRYFYSNYGYDLAAYILEVRSGIPFVQYFKQKVLDPLGMTGSSFHLEEVLKQKNRALGHNVDGSRVWLRFPEIASAGLYSNIRDMTRYVQFHLNRGVVNGRRILRADLMDLCHSILYALPGQRSGYGFGLIREVTGHTFSIYHQGGGRGFQSLMILYPELNYGVVILTNLYEHHLVRIEARQILNGPIFKRYGQNPTAKLDTAKMIKINPNAPRIHSVLGRYGDSGGYIIQYKDGVPGVYPSSKTFYPITFYEKNGQLLGVFSQFNEIRFLPPYGDQRGSLMMVHHRFSNSNMHYLAFNDSPQDPPGPDKPGWKKYPGEYEVLWEDEPNETVRIHIKNGYLYYGDSKCIEHEPGLFFLPEGEALNFRSNPATVADQVIKRKK